MPEIPDLEGYATYFNKRLPGLTIEKAERGPVPWLVREQKERWEERLPGQKMGEVYREAKMLFFPLDKGDYIAVHAMLTGRYQYVEAAEKVKAYTGWMLTFDNGMQLRYYDERRMGRTYVAREEEFEEKIPRWTEKGPDVMKELDEDGFVARLKPMRGMIKSIITNERCIAGIGNAYSDEVLWEAGIHPFRKRTDIPEEEQRHLFRSIRAVMDWATPIVTELTETKGLSQKTYRDHLRIHSRPEGSVCPRCGGHITSITSGGRETNFCRTCQK
jgi:formamidopyrimidine-DNA glycosylase